MAVTGIGVISALGRNREEFWRALTSGESGIRPVQGFDPGLLRFPNAAQVREFHPEAYFEPKESVLLDRFAQFAAVAAREAVSDAQIEWTEDLRCRTAVVTGCGVGGKQTEEEITREFWQRGNTRVAPFSIPKAMANAGASRVSYEFKTRGPVFTLSTACASSNHAIGQAFWMVRGGVAEMALAGGSEAPFSPCVLKAWEAMRVLSPDTCRPFSRDRKGMILGEGGAMLVLEPLERATARGARIYGEIAGFGMSSDAYHLVEPLAESAAHSIRAALDDASIEAERVGYINAHGTGTLVNDPAEARAIRMIFGSRELPVSSTKSMHGHALGAAGAIEAAATLLAIQNQIAPPTANFTGPDPACELDAVPNVARRVPIDCALSNSFAFGGLNAVLVFRRAGG